MKIWDPCRGESRLKQKSHVLFRSELSLEQKIKVYEAIFVAGVHSSPSSSGSL